MTETWTIPEADAVHDVRAADGYLIAVRRYGNPDGPRLVMSHGNGFAVDAYWPFWSRFLQDFDVFVHDIRSHGRNPVGDLEVHTIPMIAEDFTCVARNIDRRFGARPKVGVFHSLSALAVLHAPIVRDYAALVLFDPPILLPGREMGELERVGFVIGRATRRRRERFETPEDYAAYLSARDAFTGIGAGGLDLLARTTLRRIGNGAGYRLSCPRDHEARMWDSLYPFARMVDYGTIDCPIKVIGSDPTMPNSFVPSTRVPELLRLDYDFVPETTHLLQLENPEACAAFTLDYLSMQGLGAS